MAIFTDENLGDLRQAFKDAFVQVEGELERADEFDSELQAVSFSNGGAYVLGWVWVPEDSLSERGKELFKEYSR